MPEESAHGLSMVGVLVGNSRARIGRFDGRELARTISVDVTDAALVAREVLERYQPGAEVVIASVNSPGLARIRDAMDGHADLPRPEIVGPDIEVPIPTSLEPGTTIGVDRLLCALGAYARVRQACVVIDAGTAITVDFVDGEGVFHGGAIAPGAHMMLRALRSGTAALPELAFEPVPGTFPAMGRNTREAMTLGVNMAARGLVRALLDRYAEYYGAYPRVVATGGDAEALFQEEELVELIVPDLQLVGVQIAHEVAMGGDAGFTGEPTEQAGSDALAGLSLPDAWPAEERRGIRPAPPLDAEDDDDPFE
ncbi:MAG: type III pantothenate kinase [Phycisphaerales bacterium]|jgi:type III pantothenate kinase|nr:type III pantothenate kinase [Phycisphaerales bacterium]